MVHSQYPFYLVVDSDSLSTTSIHVIFGLYIHRVSQ